MGEVARSDREALNVCRGTRHRQPWLARAHHDRPADLVLLFGATQAPGARPRHRSGLRIFKSETKGLMDDDDEDKPKTSATRPSCHHHAGAGHPPATGSPSDITTRFRRRTRDSDRQAGGAPNGNHVQPSGQARADRADDGRMSLDRPSSGAPSAHVRLGHRDRSRLRRRLDHLRLALRAADGPVHETVKSSGSPRSEVDATRRHQRRRRTPFICRRRCPSSRASCSPARSGSTRSGRSSCLVCIATNASGRCCSSRSPGRSSWPASRSGYFVMPKGLEVLLGFTPEDVTNLIDASRLPELRAAGAARLRYRLRDPAVRRPAEPRWRRQGPPARPVASAGSSSGRSSSRPWRRPRPTRSRCCCWPSP